MKASPEPFLKAIAPYRDAIVVAVACLCTWSGLADGCAQEELPVVLGPALSMTAMHGGKAHHDTIDAHTMATRRRGGLLPPADGDPAEMRATRAWLRRRTHLLRTRAALVAPVPKTPSHDHWPAIGQNIADQAQREGGAERFDDPAVQQPIAGDLALLTSAAQLLSTLERWSIHTAQPHEAKTLD